MKTILQLKKIVIILLLFLVGNVWGQTYVSNPDYGNYTDCSTTGFTTNVCGPFTYSGGSYLQLRTDYQNNGIIRFRVTMCGTYTFPTGGVLYIKESSNSNLTNLVCGTNNPSNGISLSGGATTQTYDYTPSFTTGTKYFNAVIVFSNSTTTFRIFSNVLSLTATNSQPDLRNINLSGPPPSVNQGQTINVSNQVQNIGSGNAGSSSVGYWISDNSILSSSDTFVGSTSTPSVSSGNTTSFLSNNVTIPSSLAPGNYYFFFKCDNDNVVTESNETNNTDYFQFTVLAPTPPSLQVESCFATNSSAFNVGEIMNGSIAVRNTPSSQSWTGTITVFMKHTVSGTTYNLVNQNFTIPGGNSQTIYFNNIAMNYPTGSYKLYCQYTNSPNGGIDFIKNNGICSTSENTSTGTITPTKLITITSSPNLVCGTSIITPTSPVVGQSANFKYTISNTGSANYTGTLQMWIRNNTTVGVPLTGMSINGLLAGNSHTFDYTSSGITFTPGSYVLQIEDANGSPVVKCSVPFTIVAAPAGCITWSGTPPTGEKLTAANYLCANNIISNTQNGTDNATNGIPRELLAKITYLSIYKGSTPNSPAVNFPVPFTDMQGATSQYMDAIKTLAYLQFSDDKTPFDRDLINFNPNTLIPRKYVVKAMAEAFNIAKSTATPSPFSDVNTTDEMYGYIKRFHELGFVNGNQVYTQDCTTGTCFHPDANITREDVFVILYRILIATNITRPTASQLNSITNYFVPGNNRTATMSKVPGLDQANFNHYQKTSFSIAGRGIPLDFTHTYNSFLTELPSNFYQDPAVNGQHFSPLGRGWTHSYNIYGIKIDGYTNGSHTELPKIMFFYPDGSINVFDYNTNTAEGIGVYDVMSRVNITGGERILIRTKSQVKYEFENSSNGKYYYIRTIRDRNNNGVRITWNNIGNNIHRISQVREIFNNNSLGRTLNFNYSNTTSQHLSSVNDATINRTISFNVNSQTGNLTSFTDAKGQITQYTYGSNTNYNTAGLLTEIQLPKGNKINNTYVNRKLTQSRTLNQNNVATSTTNVNWVPNYSTSDYNSSSTITDPQGKNTSYTHNTLGNPTQVISPTGTTTFNNYGTGNNANLPTNLTVNGQNSSINYDSNGNVLNITKNGITNSFTYTTFNDVLTHTDGRGFTTNYSYDGLGNLTSVQRPSGGGITVISRNSFGQVQSITNPSGITTQFGFNANGLINQISMPLSITTSSTFDNASRLLSTTDANGKINSFQYDVNDNLTQSTDANNQIVQHTYDANDNHLTIKNPKNETQTNTYNFDDDLLASEVFGSHTKSYTYNADGSLATHTRGNGTFTYSYDNTTGRLTSDGHTSYAYDNRGNITSITNTNGTLTLNYDYNDRMINYSDYFGNTVSYLYDNNNNVTRITYPANKQVNYVYDANNRCTSVTDWNNKVTTYTYLTDDRVSKITLPNGTFTDYTYDSAGRMTSIINKKANGTVISSYSFTMDNAGNHLTETITEPSITAGLQTIANETVNYGTYPFNRIQSQGNTNFTHNTAGGITQTGANSFTYDINDNMLTAPNSSFSYDGAGNRRAKTVSGVNTRYVLSILGMSQVLMETNSNNVVQNHYVYGPTGLLYRVKADNTTYSYYHYDYRGSTTAITNEAQNVTHSYSYDPYGKVFAKTEADANPFQYVGQHGVQYESPTLTFMRARYYDPTTGRFVSEDPIWHLNLYPYADNNPVMRIDATGKVFTDLSTQKGSDIKWADSKELMNDRGSTGIKNAVKKGEDFNKTWVGKFLKWIFSPSKKKVQKSKYTL